MEADRDPYAEGISMCLHCANLVDKCLIQKSEEVLVQEERPQITEDDHR